MSKIKKYFLKLLKLEKQYCWQPTWLDELRMNWNIKRANFFFAIYNNISFLEWFLKSLCELEMSFRLMLDKEFKDRLDTCGVVNAKTEKCDWQETIPENSMYCEGCEYWDWSHLAAFFFGNGAYCYFIGKGDWSYVKPTMLLFDGCKECNLQEYEPDEDEWKKQ
jgi:hypothetical protein